MDTTTEAFDDADQLGQTLQDTKGGDKRRLSTLADAHAAVEAFRGRSGESAWPALDRNEVADRLLELIGPQDGEQAQAGDVAGRAIQQGSMNLCGPAAFFHLLIKRDPVMFATYAADLFETGKASLGSLDVAPDESILTADYAAYLSRMSNGICPQADWMVLGALRNSTNAFFTGRFRGDPRQEIAAGTRPGELADWLRQTGVYDSVENRANWMQPAGLPHAEGVSLAEGVDTLCLINANLISKARNLPSGARWPLTEFPDHWVVLIGEVIKDVARDAVFFDIWTWGRKEILEVPLTAFVENYYGEIVATLRGE